MALIEEGDVIPIRDQDNIDRQARALESGDIGELISVEILPDAIGGTLKCTIGPTLSAANQAIQSVTNFAAATATAGARLTGLANVTPIDFSTWSEDESWSYDPDTNNLSVTTWSAALTP